jgi:gamma-glutamylcyclotransferase (GGCT)/AIG2-like uncharacterized protein YtfP
MPLLFSYGTLQRDDVQRSTFGRLLSGEHDQLPGAEPSFVTVTEADSAAAFGAAHHANVTFTGRQESCVSGMVFEVTEAELAAADRYEECAAYTRVAARLASGKHAWLYVNAVSTPNR